MLTKESFSHVPDIKSLGEENVGIFSRETFNPTLEPKPVVHKLGFLGDYFDEFKKALYPKCVERNVAFDLTLMRTVNVKDPTLVAYIGYFKFDDHWGFLPAFDFAEMFEAGYQVFFVFRIQCTEQDIIDLKEFNIGSPIYDLHVFHSGEYAHNVGKFLTVDNFPSTIDIVFKSKKAGEPLSSDTQWGISEYTNILKLNDITYDYDLHLMQQTGEGLYGNMIYVNIIVCFEDSSKDYEAGSIRVEVNSFVTKYDYENYDLFLYAIPPCNIAPAVAVDLLYASFMASLGTFIPYTSCTFNDVDR
jgi:hypothetical protein